jgi:hypothetical protein
MESERAALFSNADLCNAVRSSGGGIRTPDTRIMIPLL